MENGRVKGNGESRDSNDSDLSDVEALVMLEAEQEIAVEERIRDAYREAGNLKAAAAAESAKAASLKEIVFCEGEEGKVTEIQEEIQKLQQKMDKGQG